MTCNYEESLQACREALNDVRGAVFADIDGTISHIAERPDEALIPAAADVALTELSRLLPVVALVTGRSAHNATAMTRATGLAVIGNHGFERITDGNHVIDSAVAAAVQGIDESMAMIEANLVASGGIDGLVFENKDLSASIHYRLADDREAARKRLLEEVTAVTAPHGLRVTEGRYVIEIRPAVEINKGTAITAMVREEKIGGVVFLGDDITDIDGFRALTTLRSQGLRTCSVAVVALESNPLVAEAADCCVEGVDDAIRLLIDLGSALQPSEGEGS